MSNEPLSSNPKLRPCRSPYCECEVGKCTHPGCYDARCGHGLQEELEATGCRLCQRAEIERLRASLNLADWGCDRRQKEIDQLKAELAKWNIHGWWDRPAVETSAVGFGWTDEIEPK